MNWYYSKMCWDYCFILLLIFSLLVQAKGYAIGNKKDNAATDFNKYRITQPSLYHARTSKLISTTRIADGGHHSSVTLKVAADGEELVLDLELNKDLVPEDHTLQYKESGNTVHYKSKKEELDLCHYHGSVRGKSNSWAAVSTCHGVSGVIFDGTKMRYIEPAQDSGTLTEHFLYDHDDLNMTHRYSNQQFFHNNHIDLALMETNEGQGKQSRTKRHIRKFHGAHSVKKTRYVELVLVADYQMYLEKGSTKAVHKYLIKMANIVNSIYYPLNIKIALVGVVVWSEGDEIKMYSDSSKLLDNFLDYKTKYLNHKIPHDHAQLLSGIGFLEDTTGLAFVNVICLPSSSSVVSYFSEVLGRVAAVSAHEVGHSLGVDDHDNERPCVCPDTKCVMYAYNASGYKKWSYCSQQYIQQSFEMGNHSCLFNKPKHVYNSLKVKN